MTSSCGRWVISLHLVCRGLTTIRARAAICQASRHHNESRNQAQAEVRAAEACGRRRRDAPAHHRGGDRPARHRGPSRTTLSAVARRAGVERRTLYRHFPTEAELFAACSTHYFAANPWPDLDGWRAIRDPQERLQRALDELYAYYERTEPMFGNVLRDAELVDFARAAVAPLQAFLDEAAEVLARPSRSAAGSGSSSRARCATPSPSRPGARCRAAASGARCGAGWSRPSSTPPGTPAPRCAAAAGAQGRCTTSTSRRTVPAGSPPPQHVAPNRDAGRSRRHGVGDPGQVRLAVVRELAPPASSTGTPQPTALRDRARRRRDRRLDHVRAELRRRPRRARDGPRGERVGERLRGRRQDLAHVGQPRPVGRGGDRGGRRELRQLAGRAGSISVSTASRPQPHRVLDGVRDDPVRRAVAVDARASSDRASGSRAPCRTPPGSRAPSRRQAMSASAPAATTSAISCSRDSRPGHGQV